MIRELAGNFGWLHAQLTRYTLGLWPLFASWKLFWLVPGVGLFDAARALQRGTDAPRQPTRNVVAAWAFCALVVAYTAVRRYGS